MSVLDRKLRRDLLASRGVLLTVIAIIAVGSGSFIGFGSAQRSLEDSQRIYYARYRFADFWIDVKKAPLTEIDHISRRPEIAALEPRVVFDVILDLPGVVEPLAGRLISTPPVAFDRTINGICLVRGSGFSDHRNEELIVSEAFAQAHELQPGDRLELILNRKRESFVIVGTAISPEYVYMVRGEGDLLPDPEHFGILYVKERYAREVLDFQDACNQILGLLAPGYEGQTQWLLDRLRRTLDDFGVLAATPRSRQASHRFLSDEIAGLNVTAVVLPAIFLCVAALALNVLMRRLVERQRTIIGTLKAMGYSDRQVALHFLWFGMVVGVLGGAVGCIMGLGLALGMIEMYKIFFQFPRFVFEIHVDLILLGLLISVLFAVLGTLRGLRAVLGLQPAEAMRAKPPHRGGSVFLERFPLLWRALGFRSHMAIRSVLRNRGRTLTGVVSATLAASIILLTLVMYDSMLFLVDFQFDYVAHSDVDIGLREEKSSAALLQTRDLPGVDRAEPVLGLACDLRRGVYSRRLAITGLSANHQLTTPMQSDLSPIVIPPDGLVMSRKLAELFDVQIGETLELVPVRGRRDPRQVRLASVVDSYLGLDCYASIAYLSRIAGESEAMNGIQLAVNPKDRTALYSTIKELPDAQGLSIRGNTIKNIEDTFVATSLFSLGMTVVFAGVISLGSTLNASLIEINDRIREISTLRVMGYSPSQIAGIFFRQNIIIAVLGLALAVPFGYAMSLATFTAYNTELYRMPAVFHPLVVIITAVVYAIFVLIAQAIVYRQIRNVNWLEGIQFKE